MSACGRKWTSGEDGACLGDSVRWLEGVSDVRRDGSHAMLVNTDALIGLLKEQLVQLLQHHLEYLRIELLPRDLAR